MICPRCGLREVDTPSGLCAPCVIENTAESYALTDRKLSEVREAKWRSGGDRFMKLRQQRHRMTELIRPRHELTIHDPWAIAASALEHCTRIARSHPAMAPDVAAWPKPYAVSRGDRMTACPSWPHHAMAAA